MAEDAPTVSNGRSLSNARGGRCTYIEKDRSVGVRLLASNVERSGHESVRFIISGLGGSLALAGQTSARVLQHIEFPYV